jgi:purine-binding chemotaxis protein CheW
MAQTEETCIIVVRAQGVAMGIVVDKVSEVLDIATEDVDVLSCGAAVNTDYSLGIGKAASKVTVLLDIDKVLSTNEVLELCATAVAE